MYGAIKMDVLESDVDEMNPFNENLDPAFWEKVDNCYDAVKETRADISIYNVEVRLRLKRIEDSFRNNPGNDDDFLIYLLTTLHDKVMKRLLEIKKPELQDTFVKLLSQFAIILLEEDSTGLLKFPIDGEEKATSEKKYETLIDLPNDEKVEKASILHLAAKRNLCDISKNILQLHPKLVSKNDYPRNKHETRKRLPVEYALDEKKDEVCSFIMKKMTNERVRKLFIGRDESDKGRYSLGELVKSNVMKQSVLCVLDACINPNFPYNNETEDKKAEREEEGREIWSKIPDVPFQYNFKFQILDGDENGRPARVFENMADNVGRINENFLNEKPSPLQIIANYATTNQKQDEPQDPIKHIIVRQLVREKWEKYGQFWIRIYCMMYLVFLLALSIALFLGAMSNDPTTYDSGKDKLRATCEIITLLFTMFYLGSEIDQVFKEGHVMYCKDLWNFFDVVGLLLIIVLIPCRFSHAITLTRSISVAAYFINFWRVFKFLPALNEDLAMYANTFKDFLLTDIIRFASVFAIVMMAFAGSVYLSLIASNSLDDNFRNFLDVFVQELRALTEGKEFADSYRPYSIWLTFFILLNMAAIIMIMSNILIGQLGFRYGEAMNNAKLQYDIDKAKLITRLEKSRFRCWNSRIKYYKDGVFVSNKEMISDLLIYWNKTMDNERETEDAIRSMIKKSILKKEE